MWNLHQSFFSQGVFTFSNKVYLHFVTRVYFNYFVTRVLSLICNKDFTFKLYMTSIIKFRRSLYQVWTTFFSLIFFVCILWLLDENREEILIVATLSLDVTADTFQIFAKILVKVFPRVLPLFCNKGFTFNLYMISIMKFRCSLYQVSTTFFF